MKLIFALPWLALMVMYVQATQDENPIVYKVNIGLYDSSGAVVWESVQESSWGTGSDQFNWMGHAYPLCPHSPANCDGWTNYIGGPHVWNAEGGNNLFNYLETQQYVIPAQYASRVSTIKFTVKAPPVSDSFRAFWQNEWIMNTNTGAGDWASQEWSGQYDKATVPYPLPGQEVGDPMHFSIFDVEKGYVQGNRVLALWISFRSDHPCESDGPTPSQPHCCHLKDRNDDLWNKGFMDEANNCRIEQPHYECLQEDGEQWTGNADGQAVKFINFVGSLNSMADGRPIYIHFDDDVQSAIPFTNSYAQTEVVNSDHCQKICQIMSQDQPLPWPSQLKAEWYEAVTNCQVVKSAIVGKAGLGPVTITGFGRLNGFTLQNHGYNYFGQQVWKDFDGTNGGKQFTGGMFQDHYKLQQWNVMSGLAEITSGTQSSQYAVEMHNVAVAWAPKRGDAAILINAPYRPLDNGGSSNRPASLWDVKTPGTWMDAADGPNLIGDGSVMKYVYLHHADDMVKVSASGVSYSFITGLLGNIGSAVELGNYALGLRGTSGDENGAVTNAFVDNLSVHRIIHVGGGYDHNGGVFGTRSCPNGVNFRNITVNNVFIPQMDAANTVDQLFAIGTLNGNAAFCHGNNGKNSFRDLFFSTWRIYANPAMDSKFYDQSGFRSTIDNVHFFDTTQKTTKGMLDSAVQMYWDQNCYYCICAVENGADQCWDYTGRTSKGTANMVYESVDASNIVFPYGTPSVLVV